MLVSILLAVAALLTTMIFPAVVRPLTYVPTLIVANDRGYLGDKVNGRLANTLGLIHLVVVVAAAVAAIPIMVMTGMGG